MTILSRRAFVGGLVGLGTAGVLMLAASAYGRVSSRTPQHIRVARVGVLGRGRDQPRQAAFDARLRELGWIEGENLVMEYRDYEGVDERLPGIGRELVSLHVDAIVAGSTITAAAAKSVTDTIPIVFASSVDPVAEGLVASLARPGSNITGMSTGELSLTGRRLALLKELLPSLSRVAVIVYGGAPGSDTQLHALAPAAQTLGIETAAFDVKSAEDLQAALERTGPWRAEAVQVLQHGAYGNALFGPITELPNRFNLPTIYYARPHVTAGGLMSYGPDYNDLNRRAAVLLDKILRGTKPADLPVEQPTSFELVVNRTTAAALGLTIPPDVAAQVTEWIE
jgi:putative ABC transport system substrate-binding protein